MASQDEQQAPQAIEVERMTLDKRRAAIEAGIIDDVATAPPEVQVFAQRATRRYLAAFSPD